LRERRRGDAVTARGFAAFRTAGALAAADRRRLTVPPDDLDAPAVAGLALVFRDLLRALFFAVFIAYPFGQKP
jgi:hypothetical protein